MRLVAGLISGSNHSPDSSFIRSLKLKLRQGPRGTQVQSQGTSEGICRISGASHLSSAMTVI